MGKARGVRSTPMRKVGMTSSPMRKTPQGTSTVQNHPSPLVTKPPTEPKPKNRTGRPPGRKTNRNVHPQLQHYVFPQVGPITVRLHIDNGGQFFSPFLDHIDNCWLLTMLLLTLFLPSFIQSPPVASHHRASLLHLPLHPCHHHSHHLSHNNNHNNHPKRPSPRCYKCSPSSNSPLRCRCSQVS